MREVDYLWRANEVRADWAESPDLGSSLLVDSERISALHQLRSSGAGVNAPGSSGSWNSWVEQLALRVPGVPEHQIGSGSTAARS